MNCAMELVCQGFGANNHFRTSSVVAPGNGAGFSFAALVRGVWNSSGEIQLFGNSTDLAATNGWYVSISPVSTAPSRLAINFVVAESTPATQTATLQLPAGVTFSGKPLAILGSWVDDDVMQLCVNGAIVDEVSTAGLALVPGLGRFTFGSMLGSILGNSNQGNLMCAGYIEQAIVGATATTLMESMQRVGEILTADDVSGGLNWPYLYSVQRSELRRKTTNAVINGAFVPAAPSLAGVTIANLGSVGTGGDLSAFGNVFGFAQAAPIGYSAL